MATARRAVMGMARRAKLVTNKLSKSDHVASMGGCPRWYSPPSQMPPTAAEYLDNVGISPVADWATPGIYPIQDAEVNPYAVRSAKFAINEQNKAAASQVAEQNPDMEAEQNPASMEELFKVFGFFLPWLAGMIFGYGIWFVIIMVGTTVGMILPYLIGLLFRDNIHMASFFTTIRPPLMGEIILDRVHETYTSELAGKDFAYVGEKSLFTVIALPRNKHESEVVL